MVIFSYLQGCTKWWLGMQTLQLRISRLDLWPVHFVFREPEQMTLPLEACFFLWRMEVVMVLSHGLLWRWTHIIYVKCLAQTRKHSINVASGGCRVVLNEMMGIKNLAFSRFFKKWKCVLSRKFQTIANFFRIKKLDRDWLWWERNPLINLSSHWSGFSASRTVRGQWSLACMQPP